MTLKFASPTPKRQWSFLSSHCFPKLSNGLTRGPAYVSLADRLQTWQPWAQGPAVPILFFMNHCQFLQWARKRNKCLELILESLKQLLLVMWVKQFLLNKVSRYFRELFYQYKRHHLYDSIPTLLEKLTSRDWTIALTPMSEQSPSPGTGKLIAISCRNNFQWGQLPFKYGFQEVDEMAQVLMCLLFKYEGLSSIPRGHGKTRCGRHLQFQYRWCRDKVDSWSILASWLSLGGEPHIPVRDPELNIT